MSTDCTEKLDNTSKLSSNCVDIGEKCKGRLGIIGSLGLIILSVVLLMLSLPYCRFSALAWIALIPALLAFNGQGYIRGALLGFIFGWLYHGISMYWLQRFGLIAPLGAGFIKGIFVIPLGAILGGLRFRTASAYALTATCAWVSTEFILSCGSLGFTWGMICNTQARDPLWLQVNSLFGPWTLSFIIVWVNAALSSIVLFRHYKCDTKGIKYRFWEAWHPSHPCYRAVMIACVLVVSAFIFGLWRLQHYRLETDDSVKVGLVQLSAPQGEKFRPENAPRFFNKLFDMSEQAVAEGVEIVLWPETSMPYENFTNKHRIMRKIRHRMERLGTWALIGTVARDKNNEKLNRIYALDHKGQVRGSYDKRHLVPFGEFLPMEKWWPDWRILDQIMRFKSGTSDAPLEVDGKKIGIMICFESMLTSLPRSLVRNGAELMAVPTNDAWFGKSIELPGHFDMAVMRAVETGRYFVQVGNTGISGFITPLGEVLQESSIDETAILTENIYLHRDMTLYMILGDIMPYLTLLWIVICLFDTVRKPRLYLEN